MKEFIEKLIGRLEEVSIPIYDEDVKAEGKVIYTDIAINIINKLAEEHNNGWIACSERLPEANQKVLTCDKDGWISVNVNMPYIGVRNDFECGYYVAWMPLPPPYKAGD